MQTGPVWYERDNTCHFGRKSDMLPLLLLTSQTKQVTSMKPFFLINHKCLNPTAISLAVFLFLFVFIRSSLS
jgi:hypothetical protein